jgi:tetratricopeptide (TPR) repeat protein
LAYPTCIAVALKRNAKDDTMAEDTMSIKETVEAAERAAKAGDVAAAADLFARVLARVPSHSRAKKGLVRVRKAGGGSARLTQSDVDRTVQLLQAGQFDRAAIEARRLIAIAPSEPLLHNILGMALSSVGKFDDAVTAFRSAVHLNPAYGEAQANLGAALLEQGHGRDALAALRKATELKPSLPEGWLNLGVAERQAGNTETALACMARALALNPRYANALNTRGAFLKDLWRHDEAVRDFEAALAIQPDNPDVLINCGYALSEMNREPEAIANLEKAATMDTNNAELPYRIGVLKAQMNDRDGAMTAFRRALALKPDYHEVRRTITTMQKYTADSPEIAEFETLLKDRALSEDSRMHLSFAAGKALEDAGEPARAFAHWRTGNAIRYGQFDYAPDRDAALVDRIRRIFTPERINGYTGTQDASGRQIFVLGMMRSGTTLVEQVLASHSGATGAGELIDVNNFARHNIDALESDDTFDLADMIEGYATTLDRFATGATKVIDKLPINFLWIGLIRMAFPNAKIVNLTRDPRDNALSIFKNYFSSMGNEYAYDLDALARFYLLYRDLMDYWDECLPGLVHHVSYEALTADLEGESRRLLAHCGLDWEPGVLDFHKTEKVVKTASIAQVREQVHTRSVAAWKRYASELEPFTRIVTAAGRLPEPGQNH